MEVFQLNYNENKITKLWDYADFIEESGAGIESATFDPKSKYFYVTAENALYVLQGDPDKISNGTGYIKHYKLNGTCDFSKSS